jgi:hypothetical protein
VETPCCELVVERVTPNLSYGRLESVRSNLEQIALGGLQLRDELKGLTVAKSQSAAGTSLGAASPAEGPAATAAVVGTAALTGAPAPWPVRPRPAAAPIGTPDGHSKSDDKW